jgi:orotate phosphoribosyltransferase
MDRAVLAKKIYQASYLTGRFILRSGQVSQEYFDKYRFESDPYILREIAKQMLPLILPGTQVLAGLELGGVPLATALSLESGLPVVFVRKQAKSYGTCQLAEGLGDLNGKKLLLIEDVITTGGQVIQSANELRKLGANILGVLCVILRGTGDELQAQDLSLQSLFTMSELKQLGDKTVT